jgi:hypothetical protein
VRKKIGNFFIEWIFLVQESKWGSCYKSLSLKKRFDKKNIGHRKKKHVSNGDPKFAKAIGSNCE